MYTDVSTPNSENIKLLTDYDYVHILGTRGNHIKADRRVIVKTPAEKKVAKEVINQHRAFLRLNGYSHKKRLNISSPMTSTMIF